VTEVGVFIAFFDAPSEKLGNKVLYKIFTMKPCMKILSFDKGWIITDFYVRQNYQKHYFLCK
jgi:hypothetical protein